MSIKTDLQKSIYQILHRNRDGSYATQADRQRMLKHFADVLVGLGYKLPHIDGLKNKHIVAVVDHWKAKGLSNATLKNHTSALRYLAEKLNKRNIVPNNNDLGIAARRYVPTFNRAVVNPDFGKISNVNVMTALQLQRVFGLRREESIKIRPHQADNKEFLMLEPSWCKGGRGRAVPILTDEQRYWLDQAKALVRAGESLIPHDKSYRQQRSVYDKQLQRAGLHKMHGLRHAYAQRRYKELTGWDAPINGGPSVKDLTPEQREKDHEARMMLTTELGHGRKSVVTVYIGR
jgi:site-specific recombinase XerC